MGTCQTVTTTYTEEFNCDECDKVLKYKAALEKHKEAAHENAELFCHFLNNNKDCPFEDEYIFVHEESGNCKYGYQCERKLCMFMQEKTEEEGFEPDSDDNNDDVDILVNGMDLTR